jgi:hypothetical protein
MAAWVGRTDGKALQVAGVADAEQVLAIVQRHDPDGVARGDYYIDAGQTDTPDAPPCPACGSTEPDCEPDCPEVPRDREPTDDEIYNGPGREGGISYGPDDSPGSLGENDYRL